MTKHEREILKKYLNKEFPKIFYLDGNEEIVFFDSIIEKNLDQNGVLEYKILLFDTIKIIENNIKK